MKCIPMIRKIAFIFLAASCTVTLSAQVNMPTSANQSAAASGNTTPFQPSAYPKIPMPMINYIRKYTPRQPYTLVRDVTDAARTVVQVNASTEYLDGLGRSLQTVHQQASPNNMDIVSPSYYDVYGRTPYKFLPYSYGAGTTATTASDGSFKIDPFGEQRSFYGSTYVVDQPAYKNEQFFYAHSQLEASPLNRTLSTYAAGNSWAGSEGGGMDKSVQTLYLVNNGSDNVQIWSIPVGQLAYSNNDVTTNIPTVVGVYGAGTLSKTVTIDESGMVIVQYHDLQGKLVLRKVQSGTIPSDFSGYSGWLCTYYIYDSYESLRFVVQPRAVAQLVNNGNWSLTSDMINELSFRYEYDSRRRISAKKVPGSAWVYSIYDQRDRLVFSQDGNMGQKNQWMTTLYDGLDRATQIGIMTYTGLPSTLQAYVTANTGNYVGSQSTVTGNSEMSTVPFDLIEKIDSPGTTSYTASNSITFLPGFTSDIGANFVAQIVSPAFQSFTNSSSVLDNPIPAGSNFTALRIDNYDDYSATAKSYDPGHNSNLDAGNNSYADPLPSAATVLTKGLLTSSRVRVIEDPGNLALGNWLETTEYYDDKGRIIQAQRDNYDGGVDLVTNLYDFSGKTVCNYSVHNNPNGSVTNLRIKVNNDYDQFGRLIETRQTINDNVTKTRVLVHNSYDALGNLKGKLIGEKADNFGNPLAGQYLENDAYAFNIRGWIKGINWNYPASGATSSQVNINNNKWFGMDLSYDWGFQTNQFNGNMAGMRWMGGGDGKERAYGFGYDAANRLLYGNFNQNFGGAWSQTDPADSKYTINFNMSVGDGQTTSSAYDENGNIRQLQQWGMILNQSSQIDNLQYGYEKSGVSNKLQQVTDNVGTTNNKLGDFTDNNTIGDDYGYDVNGNLVTDKNKYFNGVTGVDLVGGGGIIYNHLNLPWQVNVENSDGSSKGTITFIYDANGTKLEKRVKELATSFNGGKANTVTTSYLGSAVYQNNVLQYYLHPQGRVRPAITSTGQADTSTWRYDYLLQDHLGNTRAVLTDEYQQDTYPVATVEKANLASLKLEENYYNINEADITDMPSLLAFATAANNNYVNNNGNPPYNPNPSSNTSATSGFMYKLNGQTGDKTGLGITLRVMAGDVIDIWAKSYYHVNGTISNQSLIAPAVNAFLTAMAGTSVLAGKTTAAALTGSPVTGTELAPLLANTPTPASSPKAFVNWILFTDQFRPVQSASGTDAVSTSADVVYTHHQNCSGLQMPCNGYLYIYCSNESNQDVYFDNLQVVDTRSPLLEENHYYPFGLTMAGISDKALKTNYAENKYLFQKQELQNKEFSDGSGLEMYEFKYRFDDPQIGRFWSIDPLADSFPHNSTYAFSEDKVTTHVELEGREAEYIFSKTKQDLANIFQAAADGLQRLTGSFSGIAKGSSSTVVASTPVSTTSVGTTLTAEGSPNFSNSMSYVIAHNSNAGSPDPMVKADVKVTTDTKTDIKLGPAGTITNKTSVNTSTGVVTTETGIKGNTIIRGVPVTYSGSAGISTDHQSSFTGQVAAGAGVQGVVQGQYTKKDDKQSVSVGVGGQTTAGKTTFTGMFGIKFSW